MAEAKRDGNFVTTIIAVSDVDGVTPVNVTADPVSGALNTTGGGGGGGDVNLTEVGGATFALGQQLAAVSLPVVLTASQLTTLTPPTTIAVSSITTSITPGTAATNLGKAEDGAHTSGDVGVMDLGVRNDMMADFTGADNDYTPKSVTAKGQVLTTNAPRGRKVGNTVTIASTSETTLLTAVASTFIDVYGVIVTNTSATPTEVAFKDSTSGTTRFTISAPANDMRGFMLPMDAAWPQSAVNNNWTATCADSVSSILITIFAVKNV